MKHAREDYNRIQDPAGLIPSDEPVFLLRGQDICAPAAVMAWVEEARAQGASLEIIDAALGQADAMMIWQDSGHGEKVPDMPAADAAQPDLTPTPRDEVSSAAGRLLAADPFDSRQRVRKLSKLLADQGIGRIVLDADGPTDDVVQRALEETFGDVYADAKTLAGFALRSDREAGPNG